MPITNNLLDDDTSTMETSVDGWTTADGNIGWAAQPLRSADDAELGPHSMECWVNNAGDTMTVSTVARVPVTAGTAYAAYVWAAMASAASVIPFGLTVRWFDSTGAQVGISDAGDDYTQGGFAQRLTLTDTAPSGAVEADLQLRVTLADPADSAFMDGVYLGPVPNPTGNLLTYEEYSQETGMGAWTVSGAALDRVSSSLYLGGTGYGDGSWYVQVIPTGDGVIPVQLDRMVPVTAGQFYAVSAFILANDPGGAPSVSARTGVEWFNASGESLGVAWVDAFAEGAATGAWDAMAVSYQSKAPEGASYAQPRVEIWQKPETTSTAYLLDQLVMEASEPTYQLTTDNPAGMVRVEIDYTPPWGTVGTYTLRRMDEDGQAHPVRGYGGDLVDVPYTQSPLVVEDYEAPLGTQVWYRVDWVDVDGDNAWLFTDRVDAPVLPDSDHVWLKSPGLPALNRQVVLESAPAWKRQARSVTYQVKGRRNPVNVSEVRGGRTGALSLLVLDWDTNDGLDKLLDNGLPALLQAMPGNGLDGNLYLALGDSDVEQVSGRPSLPGWRWGLAVAEIDRPSGGVQGSATATWQTILDGFATWDDVFADADNWADVLTQ